MRTIAIAVALTAASLCLADEASHLAKTSVHYTLVINMPEPTTNRLVAIRYADTMTTSLRQHLKGMAGISVDDGIPELPRGQVNYADIWIGIRTDRNIDTAALQTSLQSYKFTTRARLAKQTTIVEEYELPQQAGPGYPPQGVGSPDP